jgi:hypothetical protein
MMYTEDMRLAVAALPVPDAKIRVEILDFSDQNPPFLAIRFYESDWAKLSEREKWQYGMYFKTMQQVIQDRGANCTLDPVYDEGIQTL